MIRRTGNVIIANELRNGQFVKIILDKALSARPQCFFQLAMCENWTMSEIVNPVAGMTQIGFMILNEHF